MTRTDIINALAAKHNAQSYLEIGVFDGQNFAAINVPHKVGVDPRSMAVPPETRIESDEFFAHNTEQFDIVFVDGLHTYDQSKRDIENALKCLTPTGVVVVHDVCPPTEWHTRPIQEYRFPEEWCGQVAFALMDVAWHCAFPIQTINTDWGVAILSKQFRADAHSIKKPKREITWADFQAHGKVVLRIVSPEDFQP